MATRTEAEQFRANAEAKLLEREPWLRLLGLNGDEAFRVSNLFDDAMREYYWNSVVQGRLTWKKSVEVYKRKAVKLAKLAREISDDPVLLKCVDHEVLTAEKYELLYQHARKVKPSSLKKDLDGGRPAMTAAVEWVLRVATIYEEVTGEVPKGYGNRGKESPFIRFLLSLGGPRFAMEKPTPRNVPTKHAIRSAMEIYAGKAPTSGRTTMR